MPTVTPILLALLVARLAPLFLAAAGNNQAEAQAAAQATLSAFGAQTDPDLILAAQTIAFSLAATEAAAQTVRPDLTPEIRQRLRSGAVALGRRADAARRRLDPPRRKPAPTPAVKPAAAPTPAATALAPSAVPPAPSAATPIPAAATPPVTAPAPSAAVRAASTTPASSAAAPALSAAASAASAIRGPTAPSYGWDAAFADIARELTAALPGLPHNKRTDAAIRIAGLEAAARSLAAANPAPLVKPSPHRAA